MILIFSQNALCKIQVISTNESKVSCEFVLEDHNDVELKLTLPKSLKF